MNTRTKSLLVFSILLIMSMMFAACATPTAPPPEKIIETVIVEKEGETVIETVVVEKEVEVPAAPAGEEGPIVVGEGNLVPCQPIPELPSSVSASAPSAPSIVSDVPQVQKPKAFQPQVGLQQAGKVYRIGMFSDITTTNYWASNGPDNTVYNNYALPDRLTLYSLPISTSPSCPRWRRRCPSHWLKKATSGFWKSRSVTTSNGATAQPSPLRT
jgi:hypothetical protein